jgi:hypothetical protein
MVNAVDPCASGKGGHAAIGVASTHRNLSSRRSKKAQPGG